MPRTTDRPRPCTRGPWSSCGGASRTTRFELRAPRRLPCQGYHLTDGDSGDVPERPNGLHC
ncbi:hypothetical protein ACFFX0_22595 [Citricoccus parietis]|uniref:Uncharacterized protein n=1 Tax=Citricoccus parietis TaxID=592307 RepID=A0ABV5G4I7_9MICC